MRRRLVSFVTLAGLACVSLGADRVPVTDKLESLSSKPTPQDVATTKSLARDLPAVTIRDATLSNVIDYLRDATGANIHVNWGALQQVNVTREMPVDMRLRDLSLRSLLKLLLNDVGSGLLTYYVDDGIIEITTRELADQQLVTRVYPVEDLVMEVPNFDNPPSFQLPSSSSGRGGGGSQSILTGNSGRDTTSQRTEAERGDDLVKLIMDTVDPEVWRENGGTASIRFFRGKLIITAPRSVLEVIGGPVD